MDFEILNPLEYSGWDEMLQVNRQATIFHSSHWARVLCDSYGYEPLYFTALDNGVLTGLVPFMKVKSLLTGTRGVSLPFTDFCEPILPEENKVNGTMDMLVEHGDTAGWKYLEIRGGDSLCRKCLPYSWCYEHVIDLTKGADSIFSSFRDSNKRNIKQAAKAGVTVEISDTLEAVRDFYRLHCDTRKKHGVPPQPFGFFQQIHKHIISGNLGFIVKGLYKNETIAASVYLHFGNRAIYKFGASDIRYHHLRPNNLVMWEAIKEYCRRDFKGFSFGRTEGGHDGLRKFKRGWGTEEKVARYYRYDFQAKDFITASPAVNGWQSVLFRKMPVPVLKMIGSALYKHMA